MLRTHFLSSLPLLLVTLRHKNRHTLRNKYWCIESLPENWQKGLPIANQCLEEGVWTSYNVHNQIMIHTQFLNNNLALFLLTVDNTCRQYHIKKSNKIHHFFYISLICYLDYVYKSSATGF